MQQAESIQKIREFTFGKELARDHALYLCLCNLFIFFHLKQKKRKAKKKKKRKEKRITPDLRLEGLRKEREFFFLFCLDRVGLDFSYDRGRLGQNEDSKWRAKWNFGGRSIFR